MMAAQPSITTPTWSQIVSRESRNPQTSSGGDRAAIWDVATENLAVFLAKAGPSATDLKELSGSSFVLLLDRRLSFENQRYLKGLHHSEGSYHEYGEESQYWDFFEKMEKSAPAIGRAGFSVDKKSGRVTTKHDIERAKAKNASKVMEFESDIRTGDGGGFPMTLNNSVYNALRVHSIR